MKRIIFQGSILSMLLFATTVAALAQEAEPEVVNTLTVAPKEIPAGYPITLSIIATLDAGADGATALCVYIPVSNVYTLIAPPASFVMTYGVGQEATFVKSGRCPTFAQNLAVGYAANGLPSGPMIYQGSLAGIIDPHVNPGMYLWGVSFNEPAAGSPTSLSAHNSILAPTAITLHSSSILPATTLPVLALAGLVLWILAAMTHIALRRHPVPIRRQ